jgi:hypothetical protein
MKEPTGGQDRLIVVVSQLQASISSIGLPAKLDYYEYMGQPMKGKSPLQVVGWLSRSGYQTVIHREDLKKQIAKTKPESVPAKNSK